MTFLTNWGARKVRISRGNFSHLEIFQCQLQECEKYILTQTNLSHHCIQLRAPSREKLAPIQIGPGRDLIKSVPHL